MDEDEVKKIKLDAERENGTNIQQKLEDLSKPYHLSHEEQWNYHKKRVRQVGST